MYHTKIRLFSVLIAAALAVSLAGCAPGAKTGAPSGVSSAQKSYKIGVIQYAPHPSLDNCYTGFKQGLEAGGLKEGQNLTIEFQNAQGDNATGDLMAKNMVSKQYDLVMGVATPAAMSLYSAAKNTRIPVIFTAVSDPVGAGIIKNMEKPGTNCTGSGVALPLEAQVKMIRAFLPNAKKIGVLHTADETNSAAQLKQLRKIAPQYNFTVEDVMISGPSEVASGAQSLLAKGVDCINNVNDNNVVNNLSVLLQAAKTKKVPVFGSEEEQVRNGCVAAEGIDYIALGKGTGEIAAKVLKGEANPAEIPVFLLKDFSFFYNQSVMESFGLTLPAGYSGQAVAKK